MKPSSETFPKSYLTPCLENYAHVQRTLQVHQIANYTSKWLSCQYANKYSEKLDIFGVFWYTGSMIAYLKGPILKRFEAYIILWNGSLGYKVFVTPEILMRPENSEVELFVYHRISEQDQSLYGFTNPDELVFFEKLISVNGVGPKTALGVLSYATLDALKKAITSDNPTFFGKISGIGKKTAERIILELKNKIDTAPSLEGTTGLDEVFAALESLGYTTREIKEAVGKLDLTKPTENIIRDALKIISK